MANGTMFNPAHRPSSRKARARQLLEVVQPTSEWEHRFLEGHAHRLLNLAASEGNWERMHHLLDAGVRVVAIENEADQ